MELQIEHLKNYTFGNDGLKVIADGDGVPRYINGVYENGNVNLLPNEGRPEWWEIKRLKPLLHPLSRLNEQIDIGAGPFTPADALDLVEYGQTMRNTSIFREPEYLVINGQKWSIMKLLFQWQIDVFGLIDEDLAVPIKELSS